MRNLCAKNKIEQAFSVYLISLLDFKKINELLKYDSRLKDFLFEQESLVNHNSLLDSQPPRELKITRTIFMSSSNKSW